MGQRLLVSLLEVLRGNTKKANQKWSWEDGYLRNGKEGKGKCLKAKLASSEILLIAPDLECFGINLKP
jgi:hypothetical protein